jgi:hypothetical protein
MRILPPAGQEGKPFNFYRLDGCEDEMRRLVQRITYREHIAGTISEEVQTGIFTQLPVNMIRYAVCNTHLDRLLYLISIQGCKIKVFAHLFIVDKLLLTKEYTRAGSSVVFTTNRVAKHSPEKSLRQGSVMERSKNHIEIAAKDEVVSLGIGDIGGIWRNVDSYHESTRGDLWKRFCTG